MSLRAQFNPPEAPRLFLCFDAASLFTHGVPRQEYGEANNRYYRNEEHKAQQYFQVCDVFGIPRTVDFGQAFGESDGQFWKYRWVICP